LNLTGHLRPLEQAIVGGFHSAMALGPLCDEPMQGVGIVLEDWTLEEREEKTEIDDECEEEEGGENTEEFGGQIEEDEDEDGEEDDEFGRQKPPNGVPSSSQRQRLDSLHANPQLHGQLISAIRQAILFVVYKKYRIHISFENIS
jgi:hypothetical protein